MACKPRKMDNEKCSVESNVIIPMCNISDDVEGAEHSGEKKITNLNTDCMEIIFGHLEIDDLLNVADSSKQFHTAVCQVYKRKYLNVSPMFAIISLRYFIRFPLDDPLYR